MIIEDEIMKLWAQKWMQSDVQNSRKNFYGENCSAENCNSKYGHEIKDIQNGLNLALYLDSIKH